MVLLLVTAVVVLLYLFLYGPPAKTTRSVEKYNTIFTQKGVHTGYLVFPEEVPESAQEITFYNYYRDTWNAPTVQTYLQCTYDDNTYKQELDRLPELQRELLQSIATAVKPGGVLVYSTCTWRRKENEEVSEWFLKEHPEFEKEIERTCWPDTDGMDGFYICRMKRKNEI